MKKNYSGVFIAVCFFTSALCPLTSYIASAQSPQGINYQAVARDASGNPIATQTVSIEFKIHRTTSIGTVVYDETYSKTTNQFGLFTAVIGQGTLVSGVFSTITWGSDLYFLEVIVNGNNMGTTQFLSVPYALHSHTADSLKGGSGITPWTKSGGKVYATTLGDSVGIGTASPSGKLHVIKTGGAGHVFIATTTGSGNSVVGQNSGTGNAGVFSILNASSLANGVAITNIGGGASLNAGNSGTGIAGYFSNSNASNVSDAVQISTNGNGSKALNISHTGATAGSTDYGVYSTNTGAGSTNVGGYFSASGATNNYAGIFNLGNVGMGTTTPSNYKLEVLNSATTNGAGSFTVNNASNGSYALYSTSTGIGSAGVFQVNNVLSAASVLYAITNGTGRAGDFNITNAGSVADALYVTTNGTGNAGNFNGKLKTINFQMTSGAAANYILTSDATGNASWTAPPTAAQIGGWALTGNTGTNPSINFIGTQDNQPLLFRTNNVAKLYLDNDSAHFGLSGPGALLSVQETPVSQGASLFLQSHHGWDLLSDPAGYFRVMDATAGQPRVSIDSIGNVGIGTTTPSSQLHLFGAADPLQIMVENQGGAFKTGYGIKTALQEWYMGTAGGGSSDIIFKNVTAGFVPLSVGTSGNIGIGATSPLSTLKVNGSMAGNFVVPSAAFYTCTPQDYFVFVVINGSVNLPLANSVDAGSVIMIRNNTAAAITINAQGADAIHPLNTGAAQLSVTIACPGCGVAVAHYISDGASNWIEW